MTKSKREIYPITSNPRNQTNDSHLDVLVKRNPIIHPSISRENKPKRLGRQTLTSEVERSTSI